MKRSVGNIRSVIIDGTYLEPLADGVRDPIVPVLSGEPSPPPQRALAHLHDRRAHEQAPHALRAPQQH